MFSKHKLLLFAFSLQSAKFIPSQSGNKIIDKLKFLSIIPVMKSFVFSTLIFIFIFSHSANAQQIIWLKDYKEAVKIAKDGGKPIILDFTASWCKPCRKMDSEFWTRADVIEISKDFVCVKVDYDNEKTLVDKYGVRAIPTVVMTDSWGLGLNFHRGFAASAGKDIIEKLSFVPKNFSEIKDAGNLIETDKNNIAALSKIAEFYQQRKFYFQSNEFYSRLLKLENSPQQRENLMLNIGFNNLRVGLTDDAKNIFDKFQKEFPKSPQLDMAIYGTLLVFERKNQFQDAQKMFDQLKTKFPKSSLIPQAEQILPQSKSQNK
jgi:thiol-disulfide isomerase/thioredoxin